MDLFYFKHGMSKKDYDKLEKEKLKNKQSIQELLNTRNNFSSRHSTAATKYVPPKDEGILETIFVAPKLRKPTHSLLDKLEKQLKEAKLNKN